MMYENRNQLFNGGAYFYNAEKYNEAFNQFDMFIKTATLEPLDTLPAVKDKDLNSNAAYYAALCGMQTENYKNVLAHIDLAIENPDYKENATKYKAMAQAQLADTTAWLQTLKVGAKTFPENPYFYQCLIAYYQLKNQQNEMIKFADEMIASNPDNALFYFAKGMVLQESKKIDEAVVYYKKTLEKDANYEGALANLGMCYTILAQEYSQKNSSTNIKDKAKIKKDKEVINGYFKEALPLYEKLRELQPGKVELWGTGLSNCYYNLQMADKLEEVEKLLNNAAE
jgi:tetratricopeptide (TPR) repeat protein